MKPARNPRLEKIAQWLGAAASLGILVVWLALIPSKQADPGAETAFVISGWKLDASDIQMIAVSLAGFLTALFKRPLLMILVFVVSFYPFGLYLLGVPGWARLGGIFELLFLLATVLMTSAQYNITGQDPPG